MGAAPNSSAIDDETHLIMRRQAQDVVNGKGQKGRFRKFAYAMVGCMCVALGLKGIITGEYITESGPVRSGMSLSGVPAVMIGIAVLCYGLYILYVCFTHDD